MRPDYLEQFDEVRKQETKENDLIAALKQARETIINLNSLLHPHWGTSDLEATVEFLDEAVINYF